MKEGGKKIGKNGGKNCWGDWCWGCGNPSNSILSSSLEMVRYDRCKRGREDQSQAIESRTSFFLFLFLFLYPLFLYPSYQGICQSTNSFGAKKYSEDWLIDWLIDSGREQDKNNDWVSIFFSFSSVFLSINQSVHCTRVLRFGSWCLGWRLDKT